MNGNPCLVLICLLTVVVIWGANTVVVKAVYEHISPMAYLGLRFLILLPIINIVALSGAKSKSIALQKGTLKLLLVASLLGFALPQLLGYVGLAHTSAFASSLIGATSPLATLALCAILGMEAVSPLRWLGAAICIIGLIIFEGCLSGKLTFEGGETLALAAALMASIHTVTVGKLVKHYSPVILMYWIMTLSGLLIVPCALPSMIAQDWNALDAGDWLLIASSAIFPIIVGHPLWHWAIKHAGASGSSLWILLCPLVAGGLSVLFLDARIYPHEITGALVAITGLTLSQIPRSLLSSMLKGMAHRES